MISQFAPSFCQVWEITAGLYMPWISELPPRALRHVSGNALTCGNGPQPPGMGQCLGSPWGR